MHAIDGQPRIERQLAPLRHVTDEIVVVGGDPARFADLGVRAVPDGLMFVNVNTPHDYARAKNLVGRLPGSRAATGDRITDART
jgi:molybdopterin-guanine dinucleotide biosynthesis protein A